MIRIQGFKINELTNNGKMKVLLKSSPPSSNSKTQVVFEIPPLSSTDFRNRNFTNVNITQ